MPGKDRDDLLAWAAKWDESATEIFSAPYTGMLNTPFLMNPTDQQHDIYWVGVSPDFTALGAVQDDYNAKAGNLQSALQRVVDCDSHAMWAVTTVRQNANSSLPSNGVATFSACTLAEGKTMEDMLAADAKMNAFLDKINHKLSIFGVYCGGGSVLITFPHNFIKLLYFIYEWYFYFLHNYYLFKYYVLRY
mgnify:CR=1 FL=1